MSNYLKSFPYRITKGVPIMSLRKWLYALLGSSLVVAAVAFATPPAGVVSNVMLAQGETVRALKEHVSIGNKWMVKLEDTGQSEFYFQDLVIGPGGRSGWHSHPGVLLITVKEGNIEWYDKNCVKHSYEAGQSFTESAEAHNVLNPGSGNTHLLITYIVRQGERRRIEAPQPKCAEALGLP